MLKATKDLISLLNNDTHHKKSVERAKNYLDQNRIKLKSYSDVGDMAIKADEGDENAKACEFHMTQIRNALIHILWGNEIFIGATIIENLIFYSFKDTKVQDSISHIAGIILDIHDLGKGVAVFPIHSVRLPTTLFAKSAEVVSMNLDEFGIRVFPQSNSLERSIDHIHETIESFGIPNKLPDELLKHWYRSRPLKWLSHNPILIVKLHNVPGSYYENQRALVESIHFATSLIYGLSVLSSHNKDEELFNTRMVNNWETLDYKHYLALYPVKNDGPLEGDCIPIQRNNASIVEISDLDIFLSSEAAEKVDRQIFDKFADGIAQNRSYFFSHVQFGTKESKNTAQARLARKLTSSLRAFRRSHLSTIYSEEHVYNLATAFEILLTDNYSRGVARTLQLQTEDAMRSAGIRDWIDRGEEVSRLYDYRCQITHSGSASIDMPDELKRLRETFVIAYSQISTELKNISPNSSQPVKDILKSRLERSKSPPFPIRLRDFGRGLWFDANRRFNQLIDFK